MAQGQPAEILSAVKRERFFAIASPIAMILIVLVLGLFVPANLSDTLHEVARVLGGGQ